MTKCTLQTIENRGPIISKTTQPHRKQRGKPQYYKARLVKEVGKRGSGPAEFHYPGGIASLPSGNILIVDYHNHRVQVFTQDLQYIRSIGCEGVGPGQFKHPTGIAVDQENRLFITEESNNRVQVLNEQGKHLYMFGFEGYDTIGHYKYPAHIAIDNSNRVYVCDRCNGRVQVITTDGSYITTLVEEGPGRYQLKCSPCHISLDNENNATISDRNGNLYMYNKTGQHLKTFRGQSDGPFDRFSFAKGSLTDDWGTLLVADAADQCVVVLTKDGHVACRIDCAEKGPGETGERSIPNTIHLTNEGDLLVAVWGHHKILKFEIPKAATDSS